MYWNFLARLGTLGAALFMLGCAADIVRQPAVLSDIPAGRARDVRAVPVDVSVQLGSGYRRTIPGGSRWERVGAVPAGSVFARVDDVFSVEGAHVHEAFLVVNDGHLIGFYLPVERAFVSLTEKPLTRLWEK